MITLAIIGNERSDVGKRWMCSWGKFCAGFHWILTGPFNFMFCEIFTMPIKLHETCTDIIVPSCDVPFIISNFVLFSVVPFSQCFFQRLQNGKGENASLKLVRSICSSLQWERSMVLMLLRGGN